MRISDWSSDVCSSDLVGPTRDQRVEIRGGVAVARGDEGDERGVGFGEGGGEAGHNATPNASATVKISLSPRPEQLTMMILSLSIFGASRSAAAMAWADSSAGMMPSSLVSFRKMASASASVTGSYRTRPMSCSQA